MMRLVFSVAAALSWFLAAAVAKSHFTYPLFGQCDPAWANDLMDTKTICQVGCLMSSTSMGLAGAGINIPGYSLGISNSTSNSNPHTLNEWLRNNGGYDGSNDLIETVVPNIDPSRIIWPDDGFHKTNDLPFDTVKTYINKGRLVIANVNNGGHFVLLVGYSETDEDTFVVNDPGYHRDEYSYTNDVVGYRIFDVIRR